MRVPESLPPDLAALRDRIRAFVEDELRPLEAGIDQDEAAPSDVRQIVRERSKELGLFGMTQPRSMSGSEAGPLAMAVARETLAAGNCSLTRYVFGPGPGMLARAEGDLRVRYLDPVLRGEVQSAFAFTEPSGPGAPDRPTWAKRDGEIAGLRAELEKLRDKNRALELRVQGVEEALKK